MIERYVVRAATVHDTEGHFDVATCMSTEMAKKISALLNEDLFVVALMNQHKVDGDLIDVDGFIDDVVRHTKVQQ